LGGAKNYNLNNAAEYNNIHKYENKFSNSFGYLDLNLTKGKIFGQFIPNSDPRYFKDKFTITR
jgi:hypothetical protein